MSTIIGPQGLCTNCRGTGLVSDGRLLCGACEGSGGLVTVEDATDEEIAVAEAVELTASTPPTIDADQAAR